MKKSKKNTVTSNPAINFDGNKAPDQDSSTDDRDKGLEIIKKFFGCRGFDTSKDVWLMGGNKLTVKPCNRYGINVYMYNFSNRMDLDWVFYSKYIDEDTLQRILEIGRDHYNTASGMSAVKYD